MVGFLLGDSNEKRPVMLEVEKTLYARAVLPVIIIRNAADAVPLGEALIAGGLPIAEITFRTEAAPSAIAALAAMPEMTVGAGTILTTDQADAAIEAGADFIVTPGLDADIVRHCQGREFPIFPGVITPTELTEGINLGLDVLKVFPLAPIGGAPYLKAMISPFSGLRYMPTGALTEENVEELLAIESVLCCGGSWVAPPALLEAGDFEEITRRARGAAAFSR